MYWKSWISVLKIIPTEWEISLDSALKTGYRLIDTANAYFNEKAVGWAIKKSSIPRSDIFLSSKLYPSVYENPTGIDETLDHLQLDCIDLLFLHQHAENYVAGYKQLEKAYKEKRIRSIWISNFDREPLDKILNKCEIKPHVIQVEAHPYFTQQQLQKNIKPYGTVFMGLYPLGHGDATLMNHEIFTQLAKKYHKSNAQIILRWRVQ